MDGVDLEPWRGFGGGNGETEGRSQQREKQRAGAGARHAAKGDALQGNATTVGFNIVNFGLPSNIVRGSGFGIISKTTGTSQQIQFSLKVLY